MFLSTLSDLQDKFQNLTNDRLETANIDNRGNLVQDIFNHLRSISWENRGPLSNMNVSLGETFNSKFAHLMNPSLFVMWDDWIAGYFYMQSMIESPWDYIGFLCLFKHFAEGQFFGQSLYTLRPAYGKLISNRLYFKIELAENR